jgi:hypothetical protein
MFRSPELLSLNPFSSILQRTAKKWNPNASEAGIDSHKSEKEDG